MFDTGGNVQESLETLLQQQRRLLAGKRAAQMFPLGTEELKLPFGMCRTSNLRGVFHYNPRMITEGKLLSLSAQHRENEFLELGPYSKDDISSRLQGGELFAIISEYTPVGTEVRTAVGTNATLPEQNSYFEKTKDPENKIYHGVMPQRVRTRLNEMGLR